MLIEQIFALFFPMVKHLLLGQPVIEEASLTFDFANYNTESRYFSTSQATRIKKNQVIFWASWASASIPAFRYHTF